MQIESRVISRIEGCRRSAARSLRASEPPKRPFCAFRQVRSDPPGDAMGQSFTPAPPQLRFLGACKLLELIWPNQLPIILMGVPLVNPGSPEVHIPALGHV